MDRSNQTATRAAAEFTAKTANARGHEHQRSWPRRHCGKIVRRPVGYSAPRPRAREARDWGEARASALLALLGLTLVLAAAAGGIIGVGVGREAAAEIVERTEETAVRLVRAGLCLLRFLLCCLFRLGSRVGVGRNSRCQRQGHYQSSTKQKCKLSHDITPKHSSKNRTFPGQFEFMREIPLMEVAGTR